MHFAFESPNSCFDLLGKAVELATASGDDLEPNRPYELAS